MNYSLGNIVETKTYVDGAGTIQADVLDNGCVKFTVGDPRLAHPASAALGADVLEQLAALARAAQKP